MIKKTALHQQHLQLNARMVPFAGWEMPLNYGSQIEEHHAVRNNVGMFDVSHMGVLEIVGEQAKNFLAYLLANDIRKLQQPGKALYSCMLNTDGKILDDLIVYFVTPNHYFMVVNAATRDKDIQWIKDHAKNFQIEITEKTGSSIIAVQGPNAIKICSELSFSLFHIDTTKLNKPFSCLYEQDILIARTGYTGESGFEIILPHHLAVKLWQSLLGKSVRPCGLGARDTLRLEAGLNLYGSDMDETVTPFESNLNWTVAINETREFIGKAALLIQLEKGITQFLVGLELQDKGILRSHQHVFLKGQMIGMITSGGFSPTTGKSIAFARINSNNIDTCEVDIRGKMHTAKIVKPPFIKK